MASSLTRPLIRRLAVLAGGRVRANHRLLSSTRSAVSAEPASQPEAVRMTEGCVRVRLSPLLAGCSAATFQLCEIFVVLLGFS
jgi:hypothetical protein